MLRVLVSLMFCLSTFSVVADQPKMNKAFCEVIFVGMAQVIYAEQKAGISHEKITDDIIDKYYSRRFFNKYQAADVEAAFLFVNALSIPANSNNNAWIEDYIRTNICSPTQSYFTG